MRSQEDINFSKIDCSGIFGGENEFQFLKISELQILVTWHLRHCLRGCFCCWKHFAFFVIFFSVIFLSTPDRWRFCPISPAQSISKHSKSIKHLVVVPVVVRVQFRLVEVVVVVVVIFVAVVVEVSGPDSRYTGRWSVPWIEPKWSTYQKRLPRSAYGPRHPAGHGVTRSSRPDNGSGTELS